MRHCIITKAITFSLHNNSFLINNLPLFKSVAFNAALFDDALFNPVLYGTSIFDVELF